MALERVCELMSQLKTIKNSAQLRELTRISAALPNETRWIEKLEIFR